MTDLTNYVRHTITGHDMEAVLRAMQSPNLTQGPIVTQFEIEFAAMCAAPYAVAVTNGTDALMLALMSLGVDASCTVAVPAITFTATAAAARALGAEVVFTDVDPVTGLMTAEDFENTVETSQKIDVVIPVHLNGAVGDMEAVYSTADFYGIDVVEDACHAIGAKLYGGDHACFSLHPAKGMTSAEGGMVVTRDYLAYERMKCMRNHGRAEDGLVHMLGRNCRMSELHAALGLSQLQRLNVMNQTRRSLVAGYCAALKSMDPLVVPVPNLALESNSPHLMPVHIDWEMSGTTREIVRADLAARGIGTQVHYVPLHMHPVYCSDETYPGAEEYYESILSLPMFVGMEMHDVFRVVSALKEILE